MILLNSLFKYTYTDASIPYQLGFQDPATPIMEGIIEIHNDWPVTISNGSVLMIEKFYESQVENIPSQPNIVNSNLYKIFYAPDFSLVRYSVSHFIDFMQACSLFITCLIKSTILLP